MHLLGWRLFCHLHFQKQEYFLGGGGGLRLLLYLLTIIIIFYYYYCYYCFIVIILFHFLFLQLLFLSLCVTEYKRPTFHICINHTSIIFYHYHLSHHCHHHFHLILINSASHCKKFSEWIRLEYSTPTHWLFWVSHRVSIKFFCHIIVLYFCKLFLGDHRWGVHTLFYI